MENDKLKILAHLGFPNTYTFTKNMAEQVLEKRRGNLKLAIVRPSAILACCREPFPGWLD
jgi:fatty acyl-CoA reductase